MTLLEPPLTLSRRAAAALAIGAWLGLAALVPSNAHDLWVEPSDFTPDAGQRVSLRLRVGHPNRQAEPVVRDPALFRRFVVEDAAGARPVLGLGGVDPAGWIRPGEAGSAVVRYETPAIRHDLPGERFQAYLAEEGLDHVAGRRLARGEAGEPGRELYSRCVAALLTVADATELPAERRSLATAGCPLDVRLDPELLGKSFGEPFEIEVLFEGEPVEGVLVELSTLRGDASLERSARTDPAGRARLALEGEGPWLLTAVHMVPADEPEVDWRSYWTAWTFSLPGTMPGSLHPSSSPR